MAKIREMPPSVRMMQWTIHTALIYILDYQRERLYDLLHHVVVRNFQSTPIGGFASTMPPTRNTTALDSPE